MSRNGLRAALASGPTRASIIALVLLARLSAPASTFACDLCAIYSATLLRDEQRGFGIGVGQQLADFTTLQNGGDEVSNPDDEYLFSSITQVLVAYNVN